MYEYTDPPIDVPFSDEPPTWLDEQTGAGPSGSPPSETRETSRLAPLDEGAAEREQEAPLLSAALLSPALTVAQLEAQGIPARVTGERSAELALGDGLAALRLPIGRPDWRVEATVATGMSSLLNRVEWIERTDDALYLVLRIAEPELLAAHAAIRGGQRVAELLTTNAIPLGTVARGNRGAVTSLTQPEAMGVGAFLDWASEEPTAPMPQFCDIRTLTSSTLRIRDAFNREHPEVTVKDGTVYRAFDLLGDEPEAVADLLAAEGTVVPSPEYLRAASIENVNTDGSVHDVVESIVNVLVNAVQAADATLPLVLAEPGTQGAPARLLSVTPTGEVLRWETQTDLHTLVLLAVQPVVRTREDGVKTLPFVPKTLLGPIELRLRAAAAHVEHILFEPAIVGEHIVSEPGYDRRARAILTMPHRERRRWAAEYCVPERPTESDVQAAYDLLDTELLGDFPWAAARDRARAMALLLTSVCRSSVTASIGFIADANEIGTGKSELMAMVRQLAQGTKTAATWTLGRGSDVENEKRLGSAMLSRATRFWHNDEIRGPIDSPYVGKVVTAADGAETARELGVSRLVSVRGVVVTACGNNVRIADDHARRWLVMRLEKPLLQMASGRKWRHPDLEAFIRENRPALVAAAHTLVFRAVQQGPSYVVKTLGVGASWSQRILGALSWVSMTGADGGSTTVSSEVERGWDADVAGADHHAEEWADALCFAWKHLQGAKVAAGKFGKTVLSAGPEVHVEDELAVAGPRQLGARWSAALKGLRGRKVIRGDRVYIVSVEDMGGRLVFGVDAHALRDLYAGITEPLVPENPAEAELQLIAARKKARTF